VRAPAETLIRQSRLKNRSKVRGSGVGGPHVRPLARLWARFHLITRGPGSVPPTQLTPQ